MPSASRDPRGRERLKHPTSLIWIAVDKKIDFDATKLFIALKYQILVAMEHCHTLGVGESLWIEVFGDVTISDDKQIEVKYYADDLTDGHQNFWNTINNWLKPEFNHHQYANLVLLTTQSFGKDSRLQKWSHLTVDERLAVLEMILSETEARYAKAGKSSVPKALELQRKVLAAERRSELIVVLSKMQIVTDEPELMDRIANYKKQYLRALMDHRCDEFMNDMFGFMTSPNLMNNGWEIASHEFTSKFRDLTSRYMVGTLKFPKVDCDILQHKASELDVESRSFAEKLKEIGAEAEIAEATVEILHAHHYLSELIKDCTVSPSDVQSYAQNQYKLHVSSWRGQLLSCPSGLSLAELHNRSQVFYFDRRGSSVDGFCGFDHTPIEFRNGIYHMLADEKPGMRPQEFHWRMWK